MKKRYVSLTLVIIFTVILFYFLSTKTSLQLFVKTTKADGQSTQYGVDVINFDAPISIKEKDCVLDFTEKEIEDQDGNKVKVKYLWATKDYTKGKDASYINLFDQAVADFPKRIIEIGRELNPISTSAYSGTYKPTPGTKAIKVYVVGAGGTPCYSNNYRKKLYNPITKKYYYEVWSNPQPGNWWDAAGGGGAILLFIKDPPSSIPYTIGVSQYIVNNKIYGVNADTIFTGYAVAQTARCNMGGSARPLCNVGENGLVAFQTSNGENGFWAPSSSTSGWSTGGSSGFALGAGNSDSVVAATGWSNVDDVSEGPNWPGGGAGFNADVYTAAVPSIGTVNSTRASARGGIIIYEY